MEKKRQLNFSAPLLSVRRHSSPRGDTSVVNKKIINTSPPSRHHSFRVHRSDWEGELEEVSKPATVPFQWENSPGRPKYESLTDSGDEPFVTPRLPPGRLSNASQISGEFRLPPGRLKHRSGEISRPKFLPARFSNVRRSSGELLPGRLKHRSGEISTEERIKKLREEVFVKDHASLVESLKDSLYAEGESDKERGSDSFSDAFDSLSPSDSSSCKSSGAFSIDPQTRDLMMRRFLPAAKAVVLEIPQYVPRKQKVELEQPKMVEPPLPRQRKPLLNPPVSNVSSFYKHYKEYVDSEDGEDEDDDPAKTIGKGCGFLPRLCVKSSLSLLNPVSGTKYKTPPSTPSVPVVKRLTRNAYSGPLDKQAYDAIYKKRYHSGVLSQELHKAGNKLMNDPKRNSFSSDTYKTEGFSPRVRSRSGGISPYRNERPQSPFRDGAKFLGLPKEAVSKPSSDAVEKILHIDPVNNKVTPNIYFDFLKSERPRDSSSGRLTTMKERKGAAAAAKPELPKLADVKPDEPKEANATLLLSPLPPPLPKSPSESWLWRTISLRNPFSNSLGSPKQSPKQSKMGTKWETMVKSSNINHDHVRYSEELVSHKRK